MSVLPNGIILPISIVFVICIFGIFGNVNVAMAAWALRRSSTCHWFILGKAILDIFHQSGHFVTVFLIYSGMETLLQRSCFILEFLPFSAVIGTSIMTLAIGVDRFLGFYLPHIHNRFNIPIYTTTVYLLTSAYALTFMLLFLLSKKPMIEQKLCMPGSVLSYVYIFPYFYTTVAIYIITIIQYLAIWITTFNKRKQIPGYMRIMKPITINVIVSLFGWLANVGFEIVATKMTWNPTVAEFWGGIGINLAVASEFWVYFTFKLVGVLMEGIIRLNYLTVTPVCIVFILSVIGVVGNVRVAFAAWSLRRSSTCHYLIISRAIFDVCHQSGHFVTATLMFRGQETIFHNYCFAMELIPFFAILGTPIITLAIGIDRFLVFHFREFHNRLNVKIYLTVIYCFAIFYAVVLIVLFYTTTTDMGKQVFCAPGSIITIDYAFAYLYTNMALYLVSIALYLSIWITAYMNRSLLAGCMHIMKPITIILGVQLFGWVSNFALSVIATSSNWDPKIFPLWGGIGINAAVASEYWIYNIYNSEYCNLFTQQNFFFSRKTKVTNKTLF